MALTLSGNVLSKISFCDKQCSNINDNKIKSQIIQNLDSKYKIQVVTKDYTILQFKFIGNVSYHQHILSTFTNGNPYMLYLTKIDGINCAIYIDKKLKDGYTYPKMHCVKYRFSDNLFDEDTIFTGELVRDQERRWFFLIDNILLYKGMPTNEKNILSKFELIHNIMLNNYTIDPYLEICPLHIKKLFLYKDIKKLVNDFIPNLSYMCKGIIFYTLNNKHSNYAYIMPRDGQIEIISSSEVNDIVQDKYPELWSKKNATPSMPSIPIPINVSSNSNSNNDNINKNINNELKNNETNNIVKSNEITNNAITNNSMSNNTITNNDSIEKDKETNKVIEKDNAVFKILKTDMPDIYNLYCLDDKLNLIKHSIALIPNIKISHYLYYTFINKPNNLDMRVECKYSKTFEKWIPINFVNNEPFTKLNIEKIEENTPQLDNKLKAF